MKRLFSQLVAGVVGLWLSTLFVPGVEVTAYSNSSFFGFELSAQWQVFVMLGLVLGLFNYFLLPLLKILALPLQIITLGLFTIVINAGILWLLDIIFDEIYIPLFAPLFYTSLIIWASSMFFRLILARDKK